MIPAWIRGGDVWTQGWLVDGSPAGSGEGFVLVAVDDHPHANWNVPAASLRLQRAMLTNVRLRRTAIPLNDPVLHGGAENNLPDAAKSAALA